MEDKKRYRHELKFVIPYGEYLAMRAKLRAITKPDPHTSEDGRYKISSIYFDNTDDKALREKIDGIGKREKFRIRYYNDDLSFIVLEKKMKIGDLCLKFSTKITDEECRKILSGDTGWMRSSDNDLLKEFYAKTIYQQLKPRVLVSYVREPFICKAGNVRITFDSNIRTSLYASRFLTDNIQDISATDKPGDMILEVKYDQYLPDIIKDAIQFDFARRGAFSKYGTSRRFG